VNEDRSFDGSKATRKSRADYRRLSTHLFDRTEEKIQSCLPSPHPVFIGIGKLAQLISLPHQVTMFDVKNRVVYVPHNTPKFISVQLTWIMFQSIFSPST
jgi:hypothetical protein